MRLIPIAAATLAGCAPHVPLAPAPSIAAGGWPQDDVVTGGTRPASTSGGAIRPGRDGVDFWQAFGDPALAVLIEEGRRANAAVAAAVARVDQARAEARIARAPLLPSIAASASASAARTYDFNTAQYSLSGTSLGPSIGYDLDLFGGNRAGRRAALARWRAAGFDAQAASLGVEAQIGRSYVLLRAACERVALLDRTVRNLTETLRVIDIRTREGAGAPGERGIQAVELRRRQADRVGAGQARRAATTALAVLTGHEAPAFTVACPTAFAAPAIDPGQPSDLLYRRPDIRSFEAQLAAARGDVDQARAAFMPSLRIDAGAVAQSAAIGGPLGSTLSIGSSLLAPIFQGGRLRGNLERTGARQREVAALYRQALLEALREAVDALNASRSGSEQQALARSAIADARAAVAIARRRYREGDADLSLLLDAERGLFSVEEDDIRARAAVAEAAITLYQALGGDPALAPPPPAPPSRPRARR